MNCPYCNSKTHDHSAPDTTLDEMRRCRDRLNTKLDYVKDLAGIWLRHDETNDGRLCAKGVLHWMGKDPHWDVEVTP